MALGRKFDGRIVPAILFSVHGVEVYRLPEDNYPLFREFRWLRGVTMLRRPTSAVAGMIGEAMRQWAGAHALQVLFSELRFARERVYLNPEDEFLPHRVILRYEDLKQRTQETLEALCRYFDIPWSDSLLRTTANGQENGMKVWKDGKPGSVRGISKDRAENRHEEHLGYFDQYRLELLEEEWMRDYGYEPIYHTDGMEYTEEEVLHLFSVRFSCERFYAGHIQEETEVWRERLLGLVCERLDFLRRRKAGEVVEKRIRLLDPMEVLK